MDRGVNKYLGLILSLAPSVPSSIPSSLSRTISFCLCPYLSVPFSLVTVFVLFGLPTSLYVCLSASACSYFYLLPLTRSDSISVSGPHPPIHSHTHKSHLSPQDPTNGYYKVQGVSVSLNLGKTPGDGLFLPPSSPLGPLSTPPFYDFNSHLGMPRPCKLSRTQAGYLTTPHSRAFTSYIKPTSFGPPDIAPRTPPFLYASFPTPSHCRLQTHV